MCVVLSSKSIYDDNHFYFEEKIVREINGKEYPFIIVGLTNHVGATCAYVGFNKNIENLNKLRKDIYNLECHGGVTFNEELDITEKLEWMKIAGDDFIWLGWDYAHAGDCIAFLGVYGTTYSPATMKEECLSMIDQIISLITQ